MQLNFLPIALSQQTIISLYEIGLVTLVLQLLCPLQSIRTHSLIVVVLLFFIPFIYCSTLQSLQGTSGASSESKKQNITLIALLEDQGDPARWKSLIEPAMQNLKERHPDLNIEINYTTSPYNMTRFKILSALEDKAPVDLITMDQIWLGEFAGKGLLTDLSNFTKTWGRQSDWYQSNWDGGTCEHAYPDPYR